MTLISAIVMGFMATIPTTLLRMVVARWEEMDTPDRVWSCVLVLGSMALVLLALAQLVFFGAQP